MHGETTPGDRIVLITSLVIAGIALSSLTALPAWPWQIELQILGSPLDLGQLLAGRTLLVTLLVLLTAAGIDSLVRAAPELQPVSMRYTISAWIIPCLVAAVAATAVPDQFARTGAWLVSLLLLGALLLIVVLASYGTLHEDSPFHRAARLVLNVATYGAAFAVYATIYGLQVRSILSATAVVLATFPLALELLRGTEEQVETTWLYAFVIALTTGELTWVLNGWGLSSLAGGTLLLLTFYVFSGISQQHLAGRLSRRVVVEFLVIALVGFAAVWFKAPWLW